MDKTAKYSYLIVFSAADVRTKDLIEEIKIFGDWGRVAETAYFISTPKTTKEIIERLQYFCGPSADLAVFSVSTPWSSYIDLVVEDLIEAEIGRMSDYTPIDYALD